MRCIIAFLFVIFCLNGCKSNIDKVVYLDVEPEIWPDYKEVTVPYEIAPMNFCFVGGAYNYIFLDVVGSNSGSLHTEGEQVLMDIDEWHNLLNANKGGSLVFSLSVVVDKVEYKYKSFKMLVSQFGLEEYGLTYRRIAPGYVSYGKMGLYCRDLSSFKEEAIIENTCVYGVCVNCHTSNKTNPDDFVFHVRGDLYGGTVVKHNGQLGIYDTKTDKTLGSAVYPYWHKDGRFVAFSTNQTFQVFHTASPKRIEVFDKNSDLQIYDTQNNKFIVSNEIKNDSILETFPVFSSNGDKLFFCQSNKFEPPYFLEDVKYAIMSVDFDCQNGKTLGTKDTLIYHKGKSVVFPRPSYDGKYLMYTVCDYGTFPIWHKEADLYLYNFADSTTRLLNEVNSDFSDSFHNWSSNSKWFVFTSRRIDGLFTRLYISSIDANGKCTKPFLMPQEKPLEYYNNLFYSYNTPDFTKSRVGDLQSSLRGMIKSKKRQSIGVE